MGSTIERQSPVLQEFLTAFAPSPFAPGTVGLVILQDADEWAAPLILAAAADCDGVRVLVVKSEEAVAVGRWARELPYSHRITVHPAHNIVSPLPNLEEMKRLRSQLGPALGVTHVYVPAGLGAQWRRWLEDGLSDEPPINVVEVTLPQQSIPESATGETDR